MHSIQELTMRFKHIKKLRTRGVEQPADRPVVLGNCYLGLNLILQFIHYIILKICLHL